MPDREKVIKEKLDEMVELTRGLSYAGFMTAVENANDILALLKEQKPKTGHWIDSAGNDKCSICGEEYSDLYPDYGNTHFCPNCGAKMEGR